MTKEELKKEAIQYAVDYPTNYGKGYKHKDLRIAYLASAEPREKQIQIDAEQIRALQKQNGELTDRVKELEAQIEKMQEKLKADLIAKLEEQIQYSTSPSCTKGMELFIKSIEKWEIKEK